MIDTHTDWIMTASGRAFYPLTPKVEDICLEDIAHGLAFVNRFNGHTRFPYSVASHSMKVAGQMAAIDGYELDLRYCVRQLYCLLHDASEAYLGDVPRPLKRLDAFAAYRDAERRLQRMIYRAFDLDPDDEPLELKEIDRRMLRTEQRQLMPPPAHGEERREEPYEVVLTAQDPIDVREIFLMECRATIRSRARLIAEDGR